MAEEGYVDRGFYSDGYYPDDPADGCEGWALADRIADLGCGYCVDYDPDDEQDENEPVTPSM